MTVRRVWRISSGMSTPCDMRLLIVWMILGIAERETVHKAMRRELRAMVITLAIFVGQLMKTEVFRMQGYLS